MGAVGSGAQPTLIGSGIRLRPWDLDDVDGVYAACQDASIQRWTTVPSPYGRDDAIEFVALMAPQQWSDGEGAHFAVESDDGGRLLGSCGLVTVDQARSRAEVGYWVAPEARGRGVAQRALSLVTRWAAATVGLERLDLLAGEENRASCAVAESAGFTMVGPCPDDRSPLDEPMVLYRLLA